MHQKSINGNLHCIPAEVKGFGSVNRSLSSLGMIIYFRIFVISYVHTLWFIFTIILYIVTLMVSFPRCPHSAHILIGFHLHYFHHQYDLSTPCIWMVSHVPYPYEGALASATPMNIQASHSMPFSVTPSPVFTTPSQRHGLLHACTSHERAATSSRQLNTTFSIAPCLVLPVLSPYLPLSLLSHLVDPYSFHYFTTASTLPLLLAFQGCIS